LGQRRRRVERALDPATELGRVLHHALGQHDLVAARPAVAHRIERRRSLERERFGTVGVGQPHHGRASEQPGEDVTVHLRGDAAEHLQRLDARVLRQRGVKQRVVLGRNFYPRHGPSMARPVRLRARRDPVVPTVRNPRLAEARSPRQRTRARPGPVSGRPRVADLWYLPAMRPRVVAVLCLLCASAAADEPYNRPPKQIADILEAPKVPTPMPSPNGNAVVMAQANWYPPIANLAEPMLKLAGVRINPRNNGLFKLGYIARMTVKQLPDGPERPVTLPADGRLGGAGWKARGTQFAGAVTPAPRLDLWIADAATGQAQKVPGVRVNPILGWSVAWLPDQKSLLVKTVPGKRGAPPPEPTVPPGP